MPVPEGLMIKLNEIKETMVENGVVYAKQLPTIYPDTPISDLNNVLQQDDDFFRNQFFPELLKRIVKVQVENLSYTNPLRYLANSEMPLGGISQHIMVNPVQGRQFNVHDFAGLLAEYKADIKVTYNALNWDYQYPVTVTYDNARDAFTSWDQLYNLMDSITQALYNSAEIDDFDLTRRMLTNAYINNQVPMIQVTNPTDEASAKALVRQLRSLFRGMQFASTTYNGWNLNGGYGAPVKTWTRPEDVVVFISAATEALLDVDVLASAFNLNSTELMGRVFVVPDFNIYDNETGNVVLDGTKIVAMIGDRRWFDINTQMRRFNQFFNANNETWQLYLHVKEGFNSLPFANMVALVTETPTVETTAIAFPNTEVSVVAGGSTTIAPKITPVTTTSQITYSITSGTASDIDLTVSKDYRTVTVAPKATASGNYTLTASADGVNGTVTINVTAAAAAALKATETKAVATAKAGEQANTDAKADDKASK